MQNNYNSSSSILAQVLEEMKKEQGDKFSLEKINLSELERRTGISRMRLRTLKKRGFKEEKTLAIKKERITVLTGFTGIIDSLLINNISNSAVIYDRLVENGYKGGLTQVKVYIGKHKDLLPPKRQIVSPQGNRGRRYSTGAGESYQMDWGFTNVETYDGTTYQVACFAMICHHCGERYIEFFPNAKQENLFIGMVHAFMYMGVPKAVLTDNMKSVVIRRDSEGHPIWNKDYESFMKTVGFETKLCKPRHPFTKGAVERLVQFVKGNFLVGRVFYNITDLNTSALEWCNKQNSVYHKAIDCIPHQKHSEECLAIAKPIEKSLEMAMYLCPLRTIAFDGFVSYEGRRFGVPYYYTDHCCRVKREGETLYIYDKSLSTLLAKHPITWSNKPSYCDDQYAFVQPEEKPSMPVKAIIHQLEPPRNHSGFEKFNFDSEEDIWHV